MGLTLEQDLIITKALEEVNGKPVNELIKVNACAGSGKTHVLEQLSKKLKPKNGLYLAYNKAIATEASQKFDKNVVCKTTHSLAYQNIVKPNKLKVGFFGYRDIKERMIFEYKILFVMYLEEFCLSKHIKFDDFKEEMRDKYNNIDDKMFDLIKSYFLDMAHGKRDITHAAYLKLYHIYLSTGRIKHNNFDLLMLDESGDINPVTLEIFKLIPATRKIMVGDQNQNIYTFNGTINGFKELKNEGIQLDMTKSFRCSPEIAKKIEKFCKKHIDNHMNFTGTEPENKEIKTLAYISRNNSELVGKMIKLQQNKIGYNLTRPAKSIFELLLIILSLKPNGIVYAKEWKFLQEDANNWSKSISLQKEYPTVRSYITFLYNKKDIAISSALNILSQYTYDEIFDAYDHAKKHEKDKSHDYTLTTAHSSKGLEFDKVIIGSDLNESIRKITIETPNPKDYTEEQMESMMLAYVACTRALKHLENAELLTF